MKLSSDKDNIYQFTFKEEEIPEKTEMDDLDIEDHMDMMLAANTYIRYVFDYTNGMMACESSDGTTIQDHVACIAAIIKSVYERLKVEHGFEKTAEWYKEVLKKTIESEDFWSEPNKDVYFM